MVHTKVECVMVSGWLSTNPNPNPNPYRNPNPNNPYPCRNPNLNTLTLNLQPCRCLSQKCSIDSRRAACSSPNGARACVCVRACVLRVMYLCARVLCGLFIVCVCVCVCVCCVCVRACVRACVRCVCMTHDAPRDRNRMVCVCARVRVCCVGYLACVCVCVCVV